MVQSMMSKSKALCLSESGKLCIPIRKVTACRFVFLLAVFFPPLFGVACASGDGLFTTTALCTKAATAVLS